MSGWKEKDENIHILDIPNLNVIVHRKQYREKRWYLSVDCPPLTFKDCPLTPIELELAKSKAIELLMTKSEAVQKTLQNHLRNDSKTISMFKLKLVAMLEKAEYIQRDFYDEDKLKLDPLMQMIKSAIDELN